MFVRLIIKLKKTWGFDYWSDEMFEGLAEETPTNKLKVGDRFIVVKANIKSKEKWIGTTFTVSNLNPNGEKQPPHYGVNNEHNCIYIWFEDEIKKVEEAAPAAPITVNLNIDTYANSCWHCRKGGIVDLYLNGRPGICPSCGRVCNVTAKQVKVKTVTTSTVKEVKENKWLTNEELHALSDGTRVFTVKTTNGVEELKDMFTCWRTVKRDSTNPKHTRLTRKNGFCYVKECNNDSGESYHVYLEKPEDAVDSEA